MAFSFRGSTGFASALALPDHADFLARPDRHQHEIAGPQRLALGRDVIIGGVEGERQEHRHGFDGGIPRCVSVLEPEQIGHRRAVNAA